jgi:hypothetical protein
VTYERPKHLSIEPSPLPASAAPPEAPRDIVDRVIGKHVNALNSAAMAELRDELIRELGFMNSEEPKQLPPPPPVVNAPNLGELRDGLIRELEPPPTREPSSEP